MTKRTAEDLRFPLTVQWDAKYLVTKTDDDRIDLTFVEDEVGYKKGHVFRSMYTVTQLATNINDGNVVILEEAPKKKLEFPCIIRWITTPEATYRANGDGKLVALNGEGSITAGTIIPDYANESLQEYLDKGYIEVVEEAPKKEVLQLPLIIAADVQYAVIRGKAGHVTLISLNSGTMYRNHVTDERAMEIIKKGTWKVIATPRQETLTVDVDTSALKEATEAANELASALERVRKVMQ